MLTGCTRAAVTAGALVVCLAAPALAAPFEVTVAATVNGLTGQHEIGAGRVDRYSLLPLPLGEITLRSGADTVRVEGLPPVTIGYSGSDGPLSTRLSIVNATLRHAFARGWFLGVGQTIYNQSTTYVQPAGETQNSRVTGLRVEAGRTIEVGANRIEAFGAVNGRMRGVQYTTFAFTQCTFPVGNGAVLCTPTSRTFSDPENAAQVDITARLAHSLSKHTELLAGLRYINYTAHFDAAPGTLADRNVGFAPSLGFRLRF